MGQTTYLLRQSLRRDSSPFLRRAAADALRDHLRKSRRAFLGWWKDLFRRPVGETVHDIVDAVKSLPTHFAISSITGGSIQTTMKATCSNTQTGSQYTGISSVLSLSKSYAFGTGAANAATGGGDEVFSFQQSISAGSSATIDLTAMTNLLGQAAVNIVRIKAMQIRLLSVSEDSTVAANSTGCVITNSTPAVPAAIFPNGGSGLTVSISTTAGAIGAVAVVATGTGFPPNTCFLATLQVAGGSGGVFGVVTNTSGWATSAVFITGTGAVGAGYPSTTVAAIPVGQYKIAGGSSSVQGGAFVYFDASAAGFLPLSATGKNIQIFNLDGTNAATVELDFFGATT